MSTDLSLVSNGLKTLKLIKAQRLQADVRLPEYSMASMVSFFTQPRQENSPHTLEKKRKVSAK